MITAYLCVDSDVAWEDKADFPYEFVDKYQERDGYYTRYYTIWKRKSDGKLFKIWGTYDETCKVLWEVTKKTKTTITYE